MSIEELFFLLTDRLLFVVCIFLLAGSVYLTWKTRFVQVRFLPSLVRELCKHLFGKKEKVQSEHTISPFRALMTAMSTTLGISTIVGPVIAIQLGGPGALLGFLLASFLGSAVTYVEVNLSVLFRKRLDGGKVMGGAMQYVEALLSRKAAHFYAVCAVVLLLGWSAAQANQLAAILDSPSLGALRVPVIYSGLFLSLAIFFLLRSGVKRIGSMSAKMVPVMFFLYIGSSLWIVGMNFSQMGEVLAVVCKSFLHPYELASGVLVGGVVSALRWGVFKGIQVTEAGVGTQTIPHSLAETEDAHKQGTLAMLSTLAAGGVSFLSGCVALLTNTWQDSTLSLGMSMVSASYQQYFSFAGVAIVAISAFLFGLGTILGNSFNGSQCYGYLSRNKKPGFYLAAMSLMVFLGAIGEVKTVWGMVDVLMAFLVIPHMLALVLSTKKCPAIFATGLEEAKDALL